MMNSTSTRSLTIGMPKEVLPSERRVLMLPPTVARLSQAGFKVHVERSAGDGVQVSDSAYESAGATLSSAEEVWRSDAVFKYKAPTPAEYRHFREGLVVAGILHVEGDIPLADALVASKATAYSYEFFQDIGGRFPLAAAGGQIAGRMAAIYAIGLLQAHVGGMGKLPGMSSVGADAVTATVIGSGNVGTAAALTLVALGCSVTVLTSTERARIAASVMESGSLRVSVNSLEGLSECVRQSDIVIGAILVSTYDTPPMVTHEMVRSMRRGSVLVDATAGYGGGYMPTFDRNTSLGQPHFVREGVVHCKIDNFPAAVPITAVQVVNNLYPPYLIALARSLAGHEKDPVSASGLMIDHGQIVHPELIRHWTHEKGRQAC
jgi:alanine dehydrogenase